MKLNTMILNKSGKLSGFWEYEKLELLGVTFKDVLIDTDKNIPIFSDVDIDLNNLSACAELCLDSEDISDTLYNDNYPLIEEYDGILGILPNLSVNTPVRDTSLNELVLALIEFIAILYVFRYND
jgi:hypothetical protein